MRWQANALPTDDLCSENAIMLKRFNRYPLIIDPSGQATEFIMNEYRDKKISKTSFLDDSFRKNLESALRFGNPLLVQVKNKCPHLTMMSIVDTKGFYVTLLKFNAKTAGCGEL